MNTVKTKENELIDVDPWVEQIENNLRNKRNVFEQTPIHTDADGFYFWVKDVGDFTPLDTRSVNNLIRTMKIRAKNKPVKIKTELVSMPKWVFELMLAECASLRERNKELDAEVSRLDPDRHNYAKGT